MNLDNKIAIVTGAASGIGLAIAKRYAQAGGRVAIADLKLDAAQAAADGINADHPGAAMAVEMDVTSEDQVNAGVAKVVECVLEFDGEAKARFGQHVRVEFRK